MERKCSGRNCHMQHNTVNPKECEATESCRWFTPEIVFCEYCKTFPALQEIHGKPCCGFCKMQIEMSENFAKMQSDISAGFRKLEEQIKNK